MTFLEMVKMLWRESGTGGKEPTTVIGTVGEQLRLVNWINRANHEIQLEHSDWGFLWDTNTVPTVVDQSTYVAPATLREYDIRTFKIDGEPIEVVDYLRVKHEFYDTESGSVYRAVMLPNGNIRLDQTPSAVQSLTYDYYSTPIAMTLADSSESVIPEAYREAIVGRALLLYAQYEEAPELIPQAQLMYASYMSALEASWLPENRRTHKQAEGNHMEMVVE